MCYIQNEKNILQYWQKSCTFAKNIDSMLSRHFLRSKVLQALYAHTISESDDLNVIEKNFFHNIARLNDLGITQLSTLLYFFDFSKGDHIFGIINVAIFVLTVIMYFADIIKIKPKIYNIKI